MFKFRLALVPSMCLFIYAQVAHGQNPPPADTIPDSAFSQLITLPDLDGHTQMIQLINQAKTSIFMEIFHLSNAEVQTALINAFNNNISVQVIVDNGFAKSNEGLALFKRFQNNLRNNVSNPIPIIASSSQFSITHTKSMVIDGKQVVIGSENLSDSYASTREESVVINDLSLANDLLTLFKQDWTNAQANTSVTPTLIHNELVISPTNSSPKLLALIQSATATLDIEVENLSAVDIIQALSDAQTQKHVTVRVLAPYCDKNNNPYFNVPAIQKLASAGVAAKLMPPPASANIPYIHAKFILKDLNTDAAQGFVGSENFSLDSLTKAREVGILFTDAAFLSKIESDFTTDWNKAIDVQNPNPVCSVTD